MSYQWVDWFQHQQSKLQSNLMAVVAVISKLHDVRQLRMKSILRNHNGTFSVRLPITLIKGFHDFLHTLQENAERII
jgi:hypothetical protein